jgi:DNA replication protein DnaC
MLSHPTLEKLESLQLRGMARAFAEQLQMPDVAELSFAERLGLLVDREATHRDNRRLARRLQSARLRHDAAVEDVDLRAPRGLDKSLLLSLSSCQWIDQHTNLLITGPTGVGKSYLACALAQKACREGHTALYHRLPRLLSELTVARGDGRYGRLLEGLTKPRLLVLDDWAIHPFADGHRRDLLEILEDRYGRRSTLVASQLPVEAWHDAIGDPTLADAILDRLVHNAHRIELRGESMRRRRATPAPEGTKR